MRRAPANGCGIRLTRVLAYSPDTSCFMSPASPLTLLGPPRRAPAGPHPTVMAGSTPPLRRYEDITTAGTAPRRGVAERSVGHDDPNVCCHPSCAERSFIFEECGGCGLRHCPEHRRGVDVRGVSRGGVPPGAPGAFPSEKDTESGYVSLLADVFDLSRNRDNFSLQVTLK